MMITFYRPKKDGSLNYYSIHNRQAHLFAKYCFIATYGIDQQAGRERVYTFKTRIAMDRKLREIFNERIRGGYKVLYSYAKLPQYKEMFNEIKQKHA
ncbi:MAG: hypothetical protein PQJ46_09640 [Spirochaetales bacterium]|nr:hypothetical protein [Spirochaetales bacterium]